VTFSPKAKKSKQKSVATGSFASIVFPLVRKVFPSLISQQIVSVQPMALPSGFAFHLDTLYGNRRRRPVTTQAELNRLFLIWDKFQNKYPVGSKLTVNVGLILWDGASYHDDKGKPEIEKVVLTSEFFVLSNKGSVGFLCNKSKDDTDYYFVDDLIEYDDIVKELESGKI
jgi:hypothetical protein